jgi:3-deoxy-alpha-D-manno-octulosonate 8-oxidase
MNKSILEDFEYLKSVNKVYFGKGKILKLENIIKNKKKNYSIIFIDKFFEKKKDLLITKFDNTDHIFYLDTSTEPTTELIDKIIYGLKKSETSKPDLIVGIGGGSTLDVAKAVSNLLTNPGKASTYQGWNLIKNKSIYKVGIPTLSGTGAEATRTCVLINNETGLKLGMNSLHTVYDEVILDANLTSTVNKDQFFYSAMDTFIHSIESLNGIYRNVLSDNFSDQALRLCKEALGSSEILDDDTREKIMVASYIGGSAISLSYVGLIHPLSFYCVLQDEYVY